MWNNSKIRKIWLSWPSALASTFCGVDLCLLTGQIVPVSLREPGQQRVGRSLRQRHWGCKRLHTSYMWRRSHISKLPPAAKLEIRNTTASCTIDLSWEHEITLNSCPWYVKGRDGSRGGSMSHAHCSRAENHTLICTVFISQRLRVVRNLPHGHWNLASYKKIDCSFGKPRRVLPLLQMR